MHIYSVHVRKKCNVIWALLTFHSISHPPMHFETQSNNGHNSIVVGTWLCCAVLPEKTENFIVKNFTTIGSRHRKLIISIQHSYPYCKKVLLILRATYALDAEQG